MKNLILCLTGTVLFAVQANGQQLPTPTASLYTYSSNQANASVHLSVSPNASASTKSITNTGYTYTTNNQDDQTDDPMKSKTFSKSFTVDRSDKVNLSNMYGSITIKTWAKNEIKADVDIKAYANTEKEAQELLDNASIVASKDGNEVSFKTKIDERNGNWGSGSRNGKRWRRELKVYYTVYMPATNALIASQQYGSLTMDDFAGPTSLKVQYGSLTTGDLKNANNNINVQYAKANLQDINAATISAQYGGGLTISNIGNMVLKAQYIGVNIGSVRGNADINHQYGSGATIGSIGGALDLNSQYVRFKLGTISGNVRANVQYGGGFTIDNIDNGSRNIDINSQYSPITLGFTANYNADFTASVSYNSFKYGSNVTAKRQGDDDRSYQTTKKYAGQIGKGGGAKITVINQYSAIIFK